MARCLNPYLDKAFLLSWDAIQTVVTMIKVQLLELGYISLLRLVP